MIFFLFKLWLRVPLEKSEVMDDDSVNANNDLQVSVVSG